MKIEEIDNLNLNNVYLKLSKNSITVKNKRTNKTKNVINNITNVNQLQFNKKVDINIKLNYKLNKIISVTNNLYIDRDNNFYTFVNKSYLKLIKSDKDYFKKELEKMNNCIELCNEHNIKIIIAYI